MVFDKPRTLKEMQDYYQENYKAYHEKTFSIDPSSFLEPLARQLPSKAFVMDVGCGSGRDLLWMKKRGFNVIGVEHSSGLAELARKNAGCEIVEGDFETYDFSNLHVDAIVLLGALVHVQHHRLQTVFKNISDSVFTIGNQIRCSAKKIIMKREYQHEDIGIRGESERRWKHRKTC